MLNFQHTWRMKGVKKLQQHTFGVHSSPSHTSEDQLTLLKMVLDSYFQTMHDVPLIKGFDPTHGLGHAIRHLTGMNSDHAEDQKSYSN